MVGKIDTAVVHLWGDEVGAVSWLEERGYAVFECAPAFLKGGLDVSPIHMGLEAARHGNGTFSFPGQNHDTFRGLPGMLADALPDKFGNRLIDAWLARNGRDAGSFNPVERLCYTGRRAMGALEFSPAANTHLDRATPVAINTLVELAQEIMSRRSGLDTQLGTSEDTDGEAIMDILRVGTSAGGARPKAIIAMNAEGRVVSGQAEAPPGYDYWLLKFDGVDDLELGEPKGYGRIEFAYHRMACAAGIGMSECRLLEEDGRAHFLTRRFDRRTGQKIHMQSLCGLAHYDFNAPGAYGYEQVFAIMRQLRLSKAEAMQQYRRMLFNVIARNQDDHTKNIAFLMDRDGKWRLSPAFDVTYSHNPVGHWTHQHQMSINGKRDGFTRTDLIIVGESIGIPRPERLIDELTTVVERWPEFAREAGVSKERIAEIGRNHRLGLR